MSTPNPLLPQGVLPEKGKSHVRLAVFTILAIHVVLLSGLLILGCKKTEEPPPDLTSNTNMFPPLPPPEAFIPTPTSPPLPLTTQETALTPPTDTQTVVVPPAVTPWTPPPPIVEPPPAAGAEHVVVKGDSFYTLGRKYGVTMRAIAEANPGVNSSRLKIGQKLRIPAPSRAPSGTANADSVTSDGMKIYTVKSGDNLTKIARTHGVTLKALRSVNNLRMDALKVGQKLKIPTKNGTPEPPPAVPPEAPSPEPGAPAAGFPTLPESGNP